MLSLADMLVLIVSDILGGDSKHTHNVTYSLTTW